MKLLAIRVQVSTLSEPTGYKTYDNCFDMRYVLGEVWPRRDMF